MTESARMPLLIRFSESILNEKIKVKTLQNLWHMNPTFLSENLIKISKDCDTRWSNVFGQVTTIQC